MKGQTVLIGATILIAGILIVYSLSNISVIITNAELPTESPNLILNPSFEINRTNNISIPSNWFTDITDFIANEDDGYYWNDSSLNGHNYSLTNTIAQDGNRSISLYVNSTLSSLTAMVNKAGLTTTAGNYTVNFYYRTFGNLSNTCTSNYNAFNLLLLGQEDTNMIDLHYCNNSYKLNSNNTPIINTTLINEPNNWNKANITFSMNFTMHNFTFSGSFIILANRLGGGIYLDNVSLRRV